MISKRNQKNIVALLIIIAVVMLDRYTNDKQPDVTGQGTSANEQIAAAFEAKQSDVQTTGFGTVKKVLPDDNEGSRHQKFILELANGLSVLVAHNIDLAPRVAGIRKGDKLEFYGEYEWSPKGGVIHWTHKDPANRHAHGWLKHNGVTYQ